MSQEKDDVQWLHFIRNIELETILKFLPKDKIKILEVGGGDGYIAKKIFELGYDVTSIDVQPRNDEDSFFKVDKCDTKKLSFDSETFDLVISFHVIPHVKDKIIFFAELKRVVKNDGLFIHVVPTVWWSLITNFLHYVLMPKNVWCIRKTKKKTNSNTYTNKEKNNNIKKYGKLSNYLFLHPLGENPSFIHEFFYFTNNSWQKLFNKNGFTMFQEGNCSYLYSGHSVFKMKFLEFRKTFGKYFWASSCYFILKKTVNISPS